jgi:two-component system sensor histidine kinase SenX3
LVLVAELVLSLLVIGVLVFRQIAAARRLAEVASQMGAPAESTPLVSLSGQVGRIESSLARAAVDADAERGDRRALESALDAIPQGVVLCDAAGVVRYRNQVATAYSDARHGDALVEAAVIEVLEEASGGLPGNRVLDLFGPPRRALVITAVPLGSSDDESGSTGDQSGSMAIIDDVTERRRLEGVRRDFVANISHELKTPIGAITLLAETLLAEDDQAVRDRLSERMLVEADRVSRTIEDLLTLSQIESERGPDRDEVPAHLVMAEAADRIRPAAVHRDITVRVAEPSRHMAILGDRRQLVSALYNLLDNAVKYSDDGSEVEIRASTNGRTVDVEVRDRGIGIPSSDLERIFERFYRVDQARSRQTGGTGLGLAIVRHVATNHDGEIRVESRAGEGSTFTLRLPAAAGPVMVSSGEAS